MPSKKEIYNNSLSRRRAHSVGSAVWSVNDNKILLGYLKKSQLNIKELQHLFPDRTKTAIRSKVRKVRIKNDIFGKGYRSDKTDFTLDIAKQYKPKVVFDAYAGTGHQTFKWIEIANTVFASEKSKAKLRFFRRTATEFGFKESKSTQDNWHLFEKKGKRIYFFTGDAVDACAELKVNGIKVDLVDLDTCGSTLPTIPIFLSLLKPKHLTITHGEFHSMRFKRQDVIRRLLTHLDAQKNHLPMSVERLSLELDRAVKIAALRCHNETPHSYWAELNREIWLGSKFHGMLRRHYKICKPPATADCLNFIANMTA